MNRLKGLNQLTKQMEQLLEQKVTSKNRGMIIDQMNKLLGQRSHYLENITPPYSEKEKELGKEIVRLNTIIEKEMNILFDDLKKEMQQIKKQKKTNQSYVHPFKDVQAVDGMFMDRKN